MSYLSEVQVNYLFQILSNVHFSRNSAPLQYIRRSKINESPFPPPKELDNVNMQASGWPARNVVR